MRLTASPAATVFLFRAAFIVRMRPSRSSVALNARWVWRRIRRQGRTTRNSHHCRQVSRPLRLDSRHALSGFHSRSRIKMHRQPLWLALSSPRARTILSSSIVISGRGGDGGLAMVVSMATQVPAGLTRQARMVVWWPTRRRHWSDRQTAGIRARRRSRQRQRFSMRRQRRCRQRERRLRLWRWRSKTWRQRG